MDPVKTDHCNVVYYGNGDDIGDLDAERLAPGLIRSYWRPSPEELRILNAGGLVTALVHVEPIPPFAIGVQAA